MLSTRDGGARPRLVTVLDDRAQADYVVTEVLAQREAGVALKRQAVLFRSGHHSDTLEVELARRNIPFVKYGGLKFLEALHVKDVLAVLRWADNPKNGIAAFRALQMLDGVGPATAQKMPGPLQRRRLAVPGAGGFRCRRRRRGSMAAVQPADAFAGRARTRPGRLSWRRWCAGTSRCSRNAMTMPPCAQPTWTCWCRLPRSSPSRERFLTELTLDPPSATGDLAGEALRDEDYLILSTVHSAKGQEWDAVYLLNVADGNFPNEFATGSEAGIEEERRLLYVGITRARDRLHLIEPQRYFVTQQARFGDAYVHGARSRFLSSAVLARLEQVGQAGGAGRGSSTPARPGALAPAVDVASRLRKMW